jgi:type II secretory pathway component PulM
MTATATVALLSAGLWYVMWSADPKTQKTITEVQAVIANVKVQLDDIRQLQQQTRSNNKQIRRVVSNAAAQARFLNHGNGLDQ